MCLLQINKKECLHCGKGTADYCEKCYQDLISKNAKLQFNNKFGVNGYIDKDLIDNHIPHVD